MVTKRPRILYFGNNWLGLKVLEWLKHRGEDVVGLVVHPEGEQRFGDEIVSAAGLDASSIVDGSTLERPETVSAIGELRPEIGVSVLFDYILKTELLEQLPRGCLNLHPAYLPYNRGQYPNVWSIIDGTPSGTTLHYIDSGIDTGPIVAQERVQVDLADTGETLYRKLEQASLDLFKKGWPDVVSGKVTPIQQGSTEGTYHRIRDVDRIDLIQLDQTYTGRELINILRARTFPPYRGAYFEEDGRRIYLRLYLEEAPPVDDGGHASSSEHEG